MRYNIEQLTVSIKHSRVHAGQSYIGFVQSTSLQVSHEHRDHLWQVMSAHQQIVGIGAIANALNLLQCMREHQTTV